MACRGREELSVKISRICIALFILALPADALTIPSLLADRLPPVSVNLPQSTPQTLDAACCKTCRKGKACGDTCIKATYQCHTPPGCACDG
jgi:hypothetical protein